MNMGTLTVCGRMYCTHVDFVYCLCVCSILSTSSVQPLGTAGSPYYFKVGGGSVVHSLEEKCSSTPTDRVCGERITETILFSVQLQVSSAGNPL